MHVGHEAKACSLTWRSASGQGRSRNDSRARRNGGGGKFLSTCQQHCNWEHIEVLTFISCKHA